MSAKGAPQVESARRWMSKTLAVILTFTSSRYCLDRTVRSKVFESLQELQAVITNIHIQLSSCFPIVEVVCCKHCLAHAVLEVPLLEVVCQDAHG